MDRKVLALLIIVVAINAYFNSTLQLHYDESYYWVWGHNLDLSYFDHPPMIAYMMRLCSIFGHSEFIVRLPAIICCSITIIMMFKLAKRMFSLKVANITTLLAIAWPMMQGSFFIVTPDCPLNMFWILTLWSFYLGIFENRPKQIYIAGIWAGCALLSKYTAILIFPGLFLFLLFSPRYRHQLLKKDIYLAFILSILVFSPVIIWNYQHNWISFIFQINHGFDGIRHIRFSSVGDYIGSQIGLGGPIMMLAILYYVIRYNIVNIRNDNLAFVFWPFLFVFGFFANSSLYAFVGANWTSPGLTSGLILLAFWLDKFDNKWVYRASLTLVFTIMVMVKMPMQLIPTKLGTRIPSISAFFGSRELEAQVKPFIKPDTIVLACDYGNASRAWYYLNGPRVYVLDKFRYTNTYRYWNDKLPLHIKNAIFVCDIEDPIDIKILKTYFTSVVPLATYSYRNRIAQNKIHIFKATN